jgi:hypothetical protein
MSHITLPLVAELLALGLDADTAHDLATLAMSVEKSRKTHRMPLPAWPGNPLATRQAAVAFLAQRRLCLLPPTVSHYGDQDFALELIS